MRLPAAVLALLPLLPDLLAFVFRRSQPGLLGAVACRLGRHEWTVTTANEDGIAVAIPHCARCPKIDAAAIEAFSWNRRERRRLRGRVRRRVR